MLAIETQGLAKFYGRSRGIIDLDLQVEEGEIFGFIGPNGAGKSTTIRTLLNFIHPTRGRATIFGQDCVRETRQIKRSVGYLSSEVSYYDDLTVRDLLEYSARFYSSVQGRDSGQSGKGNTRFGEISKRGRELAVLLQVELDQRIESLSLGNRKKVGIIQALQHQPRLLILDEPTSGLDPLIQARFFEILEEENRRGTTIFFSSHILSEVQRLCHRVGIIKEGRLIQVEEVEKLRSSHYRKVKVEFATPTQATAFTLPGAQNLMVMHRTAEFLYQDQVRSLLQALANLDILNLWVEEPSLEEVFLHYYEGKDGQ